MDLAFLAQLLGGIAGAVVGGKTLPPLRIGALGNVLSGVVGGALGGQAVLRALPQSSFIGSIDLGTAASLFVGGGLGGCALMLATGAMEAWFGRRI